ncbi:hypothetical protein [Leucobacter sp. NPDC077196]|uniref:hypothetical protein n=1 Tax=Leucobacter sp. NPDC077196 TaxID=3154959 RepID=UPI00342C2EBE
MRVILHETRSGEPLRELSFSAVTWSTAVCAADDVSVTVPGFTRAAEGLRGLIVPKKMTVTVSDEDGRCLAAGIIGIPEAGEDDDGSPSVTVPGSGPEQAIFERRHVLPYPYGSLVDQQGYPDPRYDTRLSGIEYGTMMKRLYQQAMRHPGGELPVVWESDRGGTRQRGWYAVDGKPVQEAVRDLSELLGGVEWDWVPTLDESDRLRWAFRTGADASPEITSAFWHSWSQGGKSPDIRRLREKVSSEFLASTAVFTGGKDEDRVLVSQRTDPTLINAGFPLMEVWDTSHSSVSEQATLNGWRDARLAEGQTPILYWSFDVRADRAVAIRKGDWCTIDIEDHWWIPDGTYTRRVIGVSGSADDDWLGVTVAGEASW